MNMLNSVILEGNVENVRVQKDNSLFPVPAVTSLEVSTKRTYRAVTGEDKEEVTYFDVEAWGALGEFAGSIGKGRGIRVVGRLKQNRWKDADGKEYSKVVVVAEHIVVKPMKEEK